MLYSQSQLKRPMIPSCPDNDDNLLERSLWSSAGLSDVCYDLRVMSLWSLSGGDDGHLTGNTWGHAEGGEGDKASASAGQTWTNGHNKEGCWDIGTWTCRDAPYFCLLPPLLMLWDSDVTSVWTVCCIKEDVLTLKLQWEMRGLGFRTEHF